MKHSSAGGFIADENEHATSENVCDKIFDCNTICSNVCTNREMEKVEQIFLIFASESSS